MTAGLLELAEIMVAGAQRRLETVSENVANLATPGFRTSVAFQANLARSASAHGLMRSTDFEPAAIRITGQPFDLAIASAGFFHVRGAESAYFTRSGQFTRDADGRLIDAQGFALQTADGHDIVVGNANVEVLADGTVLESGAPIARIGLYLAAADALERIGGTYFTAPSDSMQAVEAPLIRQGMLEGSNVDLPAEMISMMSALRQAEVGARVVQTYDTLLGQTISTLGRTQA